ncbi:DUF4303 domain-containing protein [Pseudomonas sp. OHS18]|uniref:DUF4303 domain-containing protein n=1 Tax=Pseudomonas sp. OHS18 TaxID=3399679 RepID=UPI003A89682F
MQTEATSWRLDSNAINRNRSRVRARRPLIEAVSRATGLAVKALCKNHPEDVYYLSLITTGKGHAQFLTAYSREAGRLDEHGVFGSGQARERLAINLEVMPPDRTNTERALRLSPPPALTQWLAEPAER